MYRLNFQKLDLSKKLIESLNLKFLNLRESDFRGAEIISTDFSYSNLSNTKFEYALFSGESYFYKANLENTEFINIRSKDDTRFNFEKSNLTKAKFINIDLESSNVKDANLKTAKFLGSNVLGIDFKEAESVKNARFIRVRNLSQSQADYLKANGATISSDTEINKDLLDKEELQRIYLEAIRNIPDDELFEIMGRALNQ